MGKLAFKVRNKVESKIQELCKPIIIKQMFAGYILTNYVFCDSGLISQEKYFEEYHRILTLISNGVYDIEYQEFINKLEESKVEII